MHGTATYSCDDTRDCIVQFCPPDDEHMCSKHVEAWDKLIVKFSASSWLILRNKKKSLMGYSSKFNEGNSWGSEDESQNFVTRTNVGQKIFHSLLLM